MFDMEKDYSVTASEKDEIVAWHLWSKAQNEELAGNLPIAEQSRIFGNEWMNRMNRNVWDNGKAMADRL